jgi:hypothetical protein
MINWPEEFCGLAVMIGRPPPAATVTVGDLTWGWRCVEVNLSLDPGEKYRTEVGLGDNGRAGVETRAPCR